MKKFCILVLALLMPLFPSLANSEFKNPVVTYHQQNIGGLDIFYRQAGSKNNPTILLLHGFPTSSHMYRDLMPLLADQYHVIAPDYPGFGYSSTPSPADFTYTFDHLANVMESFIQQIGLKNYILYMQDYGGPIGFRLFTKHPEKVKGFIIQNANAYEAGVTPLFKNVVLAAYDGATQAEEKALRSLFELPITKKQYLEGAELAERVSPDSWTHAQWGMDRPGNKDIQYALQKNYGDNLNHYEEWHAAFRKHQPPTLVVWGKKDFIFAEAGAHAYRQDLKRIEVHTLDAGHFALEEKADVIAQHIKRFFGQAQ